MEEVVGNLSLLTQVPRPSHHEEKISAYFMNWAKEQGFEPVQDESLNVMFDVPATAGMETKPLVILQVHMDMVVAYENGKDFDPLNDPITMIRNEEENTLTADGTSLGADDGAGCALAMAAAKGLMAHGPLRVIITTDEEDGMDGAFHMSSAWLDGAAYLINLDNEASDQVLVSTAAGDTVTASVKPEFSAASGDLALKMELSGLKGGHSGVEIDKGRLNGIIALAGLLRNLEKQNIRFELASFEGGTANNAIPNRAGCEIVIGSGDEDAVKALAADYCSSLQKAYTGIEEGIRLDVSRDEAVPAVVGPETQQHIIRYLTEIIDGVYDSVRAACCAVLSAAWRKKSSTPSCSSQRSADWKPRQSEQPFPGLLIRTADCSRSLRKYTMSRTMRRSALWPCTPAWSAALSKC